MPDDDLAALYAACTAFAYPSLYEGFGLPVLEALSAGAAVLTSDVSSLPEVGGDAVLYVDPRNVEAIRTGLEQLLTSTGARDSSAREGARAGEPLLLGAHRRGLSRSAGGRDPVVGAREPVGHRFGRVPAHELRRMGDPFGGRPREWPRGEPAGEPQPVPGQEVSAASPQTSGIAPDRLATIGRPAAIASARTSPNCSSQKKRGMSPR